ncbi:hypothetical protein BC828DRAFT_413713 [Blastocladiella britannica]|nr:hypothetical protein BC828DRAFT_413713 [Blastocladiella britannica]
MSATQNQPDNTQAEMQVVYGEQQQQQQWAYVVEGEQESLCRVSTATTTTTMAYPKSGAFPAAGELPHVVASAEEHARAAEKHRDRPVPEHLLPHLDALPPPVHPGVPAARATGHVHVRTLSEEEAEHLAHQERGHIGQSHRTNRDLADRIQSAHMASDLHKRRTGHALHVCEDLVRSCSMYPESRMVPHHHP